MGKGMILGLYLTMLATLFQCSGNNEPKREETNIKTSISSVVDKYFMEVWERDYERGDYRVQVLSTVLSEDIYRDGKLVGGGASDPMNIEARVFYKERPIARVLVGDSSRYETFGPVDRAIIDEIIDSALVSGKSHQRRKHSITEERFYELLEQYRH